MQKIEILGTIGRDLEIKNLNGSETAVFSVAVNSVYRNQDGEKVESTNWYNIYSKQKGRGEYLKKGANVFVRGNLRVSIYKDKQNENKISLDVTATEIEITKFLPKESNE